jgi:hypothetical protein
MKQNTVYIVTLIKGNETYTFYYDEDRRKDSLRQLGMFASKLN